MIDHTDRAIKGMLDSMHNQLKNPGGIKQHGFHDRTKPSLDYGPGTPATVGRVNEWPKKIKIRTPA